MAEKLPKLMGDTMGQYGVIEGRFLVDKLIYL
jgi:ABC-type transporter lipoprotein component MlaA